MSDPWRQPSGEHFERVGYADSEGNSGELWVPEGKFEQMEQEARADYQNKYGGRSN